MWNLLVTYNVLYNTIILVLIALVKYFNKISLIGKMQNFSLSNHVAVSLYKERNWFEIFSATQEAYFK